MLPNTPPTYVGAKRRTGPVDFHINKMRALNLSAKYMKKVEDDLRGLPGSFSDLPMTPLMKIGEMAGSNVFDQVNKSTANALKKQRMRKMASQTAKQASRTARRHHPDTTTPFPQHRCTTSPSSMPLCRDFFTRASQPEVGSFETERT